MSRPITLELDLGALNHNVKQIRKLAPRSKILAMVKANAYGHGLVPIARALANSVEGFGVSCSEEAIYLRRAGIKQRIVLMEGCFSISELPSLHSYQLDIVLHNSRQLRFLTQQSFAKPVNVWIKINTGMNRLGFSYQDFPDVWQQCQACPWINVMCVMTHFASAHKPTEATTLRQIKQFEQTVKHLAVEKSLANSAAILTQPNYLADWIRPGLILYGVSPFSNTCGVQHGLRPVMNLKSEIVSVNQLQPGDSVGYGELWSAPDSRRIGVVAIGYGDGYPHRAKNGTPVLVNEKLVELIGQVSMDMLTVDLHSQPDAKPGDPVKLWGSGLPVEQLAIRTSMFRYELLCGINRGGLIRMHTKESNDAKNDAKKND